MALRGDLRRALLKDGVRKVDEWTARHGVAEVEFPSPDTDPVHGCRIDPFFNVNRAEDLERANALLAAGFRDANFS